MGNTFGATAFTSYGSFWLTLIALMVLPKLGFAADSGASMAAYLTVWGAFTVVMFVGTLKLNRTLQIIFGSASLLFFLLAYGKASGNEEVIRFAGFEGIFCGASAMYGAGSQRNLWPLRITPRDRSSQGFNLKRPSSGVSQHRRPWAGCGANGRTFTLRRQATRSFKKKAK